MLMPRTIAHVGVVGCFAISQPLLDLLGRHPEFLVAHQIGSGSLVALAVALVWGPLLVSALGIGVAGQVSNRAALALAHGLLAIFAGATCLPILERVAGLPWPIEILLSLAIGVAMAVLYASRLVVRQFFDVLGLALFVLPVLFLFHSPAENLLLARADEIPSAPRIERPAPIVVMIFDELPVVSLMSRSGAVDARRYPHFAAFASDATWFKNTSTVAIYTETAVPAILTGLMPEKPSPPATYENLPRNIYTLLGDHYRIHRFEAITRLCPDRLCRDDRVGTIEGRTLLSDLALLYLHLLAPVELRPHLPRVTENWKGFAPSSSPVVEPAKLEGRAKKKARKEKELADKALSTGTDFQRFLREMDRPVDDRPTLHVFHMIIPHPPWRYLPSGRRYPGPADGYGITPHWSKDEWETTYAYQRHLLQVGFADRMLGQLMRRLRKLGIYEEAVVVVVADHGAGFTPTLARRTPVNENAAVWLLVPLLITRPGVAGGDVDERLLLTIDVVPTIADAIGAKIPWPVDGHSAFSETFPVRDQVEVVRSKIENHSYSFETLLSTREEALARKTRIFGAESGTRGLYVIGPHREMIGKSLSQLSLISGKDSRYVRLRGASRYLNVDLDASELPTLVEGRLEGFEIANKPVVAIVVNNQVAAVVPAYHTAKYGVSFAAMIPQKSLRLGRNRLAIFQVLGSGASTRMKLIEVSAKSRR